jgi:hypothetical protein
MTRIITTPTPQTSSLPWFLTTQVTCPKCATQFYLTPEDMQPMGGPFGASDTIWHWWRELVEGDPTTAPLDLSNMRLDPAQVYGPCPICAWMIAVRGPHYGMAKTQDITVDPGLGTVQSYVAAGARRVLWRQRDANVSPAAGWIVGLFADAGGNLLMVSADGAYATGITRDLATMVILPNYVYCLHTSTAVITSDQAQALDADLCATLVRLGLQV